MKTNFEQPHKESKKVVWMGVLRPYKNCNLHLNIFYD